MSEFVSSLEANLTVDSYLYSSEEAVILWSDGRVERKCLTDIEWSEALSQLQKIGFLNAD